MYICISSTISDVCNTVSEYIHVFMCICISDVCNTFSEYIHVFICTTFSEGIYVLVRVCASIVCECIYVLVRVGVYMYW